MLHKKHTYTLYYTHNNYERNIYREKKRILFYNIIKKIKS